MYNDWITVCLPNTRDSGVWLPHSHHSEISTTRLEAKIDGDKNTAGETDIKDIPVPSMISVHRPGLGA